MSFLDTLKAKAEAELTSLKASADAAELRIEAAFNLGAVHAQLAQIEADASTLETKLFPTTKTRLA